LTAQHVANYVSDTYTVNRLTYGEHHVLKLFIRTKLLICLSIIIFGLCVSAGAQSRTDRYIEAETVFKKMSPEERIYLQTLLATAGYWNAVPNLEFSVRIFEAVKRLQAEMGQEQSGLLSIRELVQLERNAIPLLRKWNFRLVRHPDRPITIWVPFGLNLNLKKNEYGLTYQDSDDKINISYKLFASLELKETYEQTLKTMRERGETVHFSVLRPQFYVISSSTNSGIDRYERYHRDGNGIIGFQQSWRNNATDIKAAAVATLISASLWSQYNRIQLQNPERLLSYRYKLPDEVIAPKTTNLPAAPSPPPERNEGRSSGTGFVATGAGHIVTNAHVIEKCTTIEISTPDQTAISARIAARDEVNDIALLVAPELKIKDVGEIRQGIKLGEQVAAFGFPLSGVLSNSGNFTLGNVTSLAGLSNDSRYLQISTPVQPGNSGGPLVDQHGNVVGIVTSKLNALRTAVATGDIPQNVNFALKVGAASNLLETHGISLKLGNTERVLTTVELAERAGRLSVQVKCKP
jgi:serine protease Do